MRSSAHDGAFGAAVISTDQGGRIMAAAQSALALERSSAPAATKLAVAAGADLVDGVDALGQVLGSPVNSWRIERSAR